MLKISCVMILLASSAPCIVNALTAHLVPHTHDDAGWLKTVDEYYLGLDPLSSCELSILRLSESSQLAHFSS